MAFSSSFSHISSFPHTPTRPSITTTARTSLPHFGGKFSFSIKAVADNNDNQETASSAASETEPKPAAPKAPKKPVFSMKKGQIVRVDKEKYLNSINYLSVGHPPYYKGLDYIYEDRGEVLDIRIFETGEYALIAWVGIPTSPAWLPTDMLIKSDKLNYERI